MCTHQWCGITLGKTIELIREITALQNVWLKIKAFSCDGWTRLRLESTSPAPAWLFWHCIFQFLICYLLLRNISWTKSKNVVLFVVRCDVIKQTKWVSLVVNSNKFRKTEPKSPLKRHPNDASKTSLVTEITIHCPQSSLHWLFYMFLE